MRFWRFVALALVATPGPAHHVAAGFDYRFDTPVAAGHAGDHPLWGRVLERHAHEAATLDACLADAAVCPRHLRGWRRVVLRADGLNPHAQLVLVNRFFNKRRYVSDVIDEQTGVGYWHTLNHFFA